MSKILVVKAGDYFLYCECLYICSEKLKTNNNPRSISSFTEHRAIPNRTAATCEDRGLPSNLGTRSTCTSTRYSQRWEVTGDPPQKSLLEPWITTFLCHNPLHPHSLLSERAMNTQHSREHSRKGWEKPLAPAPPGNATSTTHIPGSSDPDFPLLKHLLL